MNISKIQQVLKDLTIRPENIQDERLKGVFITLLQLIEDLCDEK